MSIKLKVGQPVKAKNLGSLIDGDLGKVVDDRWSPNYRIQFIRGSFIGKYNLHRSEIETKLTPLELMKIEVYL